MSIYKLKLSPSEITDEDSFYRKRRSATEINHQSAQYDIKQGVWDGRTENLSILSSISQAAVAMAMLCGLIILPPQRGSRGVGGNQPVFLTALHTKNVLCPRHTQLIGNMSLELGKEDIRRGIRTRYEGSDGAIIGATRG